MGVEREGPDGFDLLVGVIAGIGLAFVGAVLAGAWLALAVSGGGGVVPLSAGRRARWCPPSTVPLIEHHTSGHASVEDLRRLVDAFLLARVVPIHSEATDRFADHFPRVEPHPDGVWWEV